MKRFEAVCNAPGAWAVYEGNRTVAFVENPDDHVSAANAAGVLAAALNDAVKTRQGE